MFYIKSVIENNMDQKNKRREDDWNKNILSKSELKDSNLYRNHPEYSSMSKSESGSGEVVFVRGFKQQNSKTTFDILKRLKKISDMTEGCNPYNIVTPIAKSKGEPEVDNLKTYAASCIYPPAGVKSEDWINNGMPGRKCE